MDSWVFKRTGYLQESEGVRESLFTLGNGYFATRGAGCETEADASHYPGTYLAGGYDRAVSDVAGRPVENEDLVNVPNWLPLTFAAEDGSWLSLDSMDVLDYEQSLDMRAGLLTREMRVRDVQGCSTEVRERRLISMDDMHLAAIELLIVPQGWSGTMTLRSALDGTVLNQGVERYRGLNSHHLEPLDRGKPAEDQMLLVVETSQSRLRIAQAARTTVFLNGRLVQPERHFTGQSGKVSEDIVLEVADGDEVRIEKVVSLYTSRDNAVAECALDARRSVGDAPDFSGLARKQAVAWGHLWRRFDIDLGMSDAEEQVRVLSTLRLHMFHLLQTSSPLTMDLDAGVPARGWHGEAYRGHILWDELFIFPILNLRLPEITRSLLMYRYRRLGEARRAATASGLRGAMYPWQSGSNGREESQRVHLNPRSGNWILDNSSLQRHVNSAIAYNIWQYYQVTRDLEFLNFYGAEMMLEVARFWASMVSYDEASERYEIRGVMGPDEYHDAYPGAEEPGLNNNAYTNLMAAWVLCRTQDVLEALPKNRETELRETLRIEDRELEEWDRISRRLKVPFHDGDVISQFEGYGELEEFDWDGYREKYDDIQRLDRILESEGDTPNRYKASKQADVLMLFYLFSADELGELFEHLGYSFGPESIPKNVDYYLNRTSHGSTLSRVVHSWVLSRSNRKRSWALFQEALESDVNDVQGGTTEEGIHLGAMAGTVDVLQRCYTGLGTTGDSLVLDPKLPDDCFRLHLDIVYRGQALSVDIDQHELRVVNLSGRTEEVALSLSGKDCLLSAGETIVQRLT